MFQVTFRFIGNEDLQIAYFEREITAMGFVAIARQSDLIKETSKVEFVMLKCI